MRKHLICSIILIVASAYVAAQQNDTIKTDVITITKSYNPSILDAFKVKETPVLDDAVTNKKEVIEYNIFSFPVASTFTPAKGKSITLDKAKQEVLYNNFVSVAYGSFDNVLADLYINHSLNRDETISGYINHHSSQGGIDGIQLNDDFYNSKLNIDYNNNHSRDALWNVGSTLKHQYYNWYGVPEIYNNANFADNTNVSHTFYTADLHGNVSFENSYFKSTDVLLRHFADSNSSSENYLNLNADANFPIGYQELSTKLRLEYLGGGFDKNYEANKTLNYRNILLELSPTYKFQQDNFRLNLGVTGVYLNNMESGENNFFIYPNVLASYDIIKNKTVAYLGVTGNLLQNTYYDFAQINPYVSPTLTITPTDKAYEAFVGIKGKLSENFGYNLKARYMQENEKAFFKSNVTNSTAVNKEPYQYQNSYNVVYDNTKTISVLGELNVAVNDALTVKFNAEFFDFNTNIQTEAWNLPNITANLFTDYQIGHGWFAGANLFYVGKRLDQISSASTTFPMETLETKTLNSYFDANAHVGYTINNRFSIFVKGHNLANNSYQKWLNYYVQPIQILGGLSYKFDF